MDSSKKLGVIFVVISALTFSTAGLFSKGVAAAPWDIIFWRGVFSAGFTLCWICHRQRLRENFLLMGISGLSVAVIGALGTSAFIAAFKLTSIANVSLIYAVVPLLAGVFAWVWMGERMTRHVVCGAVLALGGVAIIVSGSLGRASFRGDMLAFCMALALALMMVIYRKYPSTPGAGPSALSSLLLVPCAMLWGDPFSIPLHEILILSGFGLVFAVASVTLVEGAKHIPSGQAALLSTLEVPVAPILAFLVLSEVPGSRTVFGGALVLVAVLLSLRENK